MLQPGRSIPETHVTPTSHFFWWRRRQTRRRGLTHHAVDLSRGGDENKGSIQAQPVKVEPGGYKCQYTTTSGNSISETHLSPTPWIVGLKPGGHAAGVPSSCRSSYLNPVPEARRQGTRKKELMV